MFWRFGLQHYKALEDGAPDCVVHSSTGVVVYEGTFEVCLAFVENASVVAGHLVTSVYICPHIVTYVIDGSGTVVGVYETRV